MAHNLIEKRKRIIAPVMAFAVFAGSLFGACVVDPIPAYAAKVTLKGIDAIAEAHSITDSDTNPKPFVILEIVPDKTYDAAIGYLVGGEEPIHDGKSLKDMPSTAERNRYMNGDTDGTKAYDPTIDPNNNTENQPPNFDMADAVAYELNGNAFSFSKYYEPKEPDASGRTMDVRGYFVADENGQYVPNDFSDAYKKKYADSAGTDPDDPTNELIDITDTAGSGLYGKKVADTEQIYRRSDSYAKRDDYYTGNYIFDIKKITDEAAQLPVLTQKDSTIDYKSSTNAYNWQYFYITKVTDSDQLTEGAIIYRAVKDGSADNPDYYGYVKRNDAGELVVHPKNYGDTVTDGSETTVIDDIKISEFAEGSTLPIISFKAARRLTSSAPSGATTPTPTASVTPTATPTLDPDATPTATPTENPDDPDNPDDGTTDAPTPTVTPTAGDGGSDPDGGTDPAGDTDPSGDPDSSGSADPSGGTDTSGGTNPSGGSTDPTPEPDPDSGASIGRYPFLNEKNIKYTGVIESKSTEYAVLGAMRSDLEYDYYILSETSSGDTEHTLYCIDGDSVTEDADGVFGRKNGYSAIIGTEYSSTNAATDKGPYYIQTSEADEYMFKLTPGTDEDKYRFIADYSREIYHNISYSGGFYNNEWFKQYVLDREAGSACDNLYIDVVTVTAKELSEKPDLISNANLIYFTGGRYKDDISATNAVNILNKVVNEDFPVMIERSMYYANLYDENAFDPADDAETQAKDKAEKVNITLLALELMQSQLKTPRGTENDEWSVSDWEAIAGSTAINASDPTADNFYNRASAEIIETYTDGTKKGYYSGKTVVDTVSDPGTQIAASSVSTKRSDLLKSMRYGYDSNADVSFVRGTVFVNDDWNDEDKSASVYGREIKAAKIVRSDFNAQYSDTKINGINGFQEIYDEYDNERPIIETYGSWDDFNSKISKATCIRYILNANNNRYAVKTKLRILDLEPLETAQYSSQSDLSNNIYYGGFDRYYSLTFEKDAYGRERDYLTADWIKTNLDFEGDESAISINQMGTREFIGINTDLNETYDMIYIGMDTALMNTAFGRDMVKTRRTQYNNTALNGLVYAHAGDSMGYTWYGHNGEQRFMSGNDITINKKRELINYLKAGYTILLSDDFFRLNDQREIITDENGIVSASSINTEKLDSSSQLYDFIVNTVLARNDDGYIYFRKNVYRRGELESVTPSYQEARTRFARYLNISKLEIVVNKAPIEYNEVTQNNETAHHYLEANPDGSYSLDFEIQLKNDVALDASSTSYNCKLYIDYDSDGKFEADEELGGVSVNGNTVDSEGRFYLKTGETYSISRMVPEDYIGFLPWKLAFIQNEKETSQSGNDETSVRCAVTGFCAVPADPDNRPTINVLQILPNNSNTLDLRADAFTNPTTGWYAQVRDFEVDVKQVTANDYVKKLDNANNAGNLSYYDYLCQFDMVVLGFADIYDFTPSDYWINVPIVRSDALGNPYIEHRQVIRDDAMYDALLAVREYCIAGKSILFTHDLTSPAYDSGNVTEWGYYMNQLLRDVQGLDRYGHHSDNTDLKYKFDSDRTVKNYEYVYETNRSIKGDVTADDYGMSDAEVMRKRHTAGDGSNWGATTRSITYNYNPEDRATPWMGGTETVTAINEGQITQYPFLITQGTSGDSDQSQFEVAMTHSQYFQLDLDTDFKDDNYNDDLVVWYAISNRDDDTRSGTLHEYYKALHNDVRNNYYIFTKGNVTYTGSGHSAVNSAKEQQLFVNTLVAAYNSGVRSPKVIYKENPWEQSANIRGINLPYDVNLTMSEAANDSAGGWLDDTVTINFKTINNNFKGSKNGLNTRYFVEVAPGTGTVNLAGQSFKEITPVKFCLMEYDGTKNYGVSPYLLENYRIYQATFNTSDLDLGGASGALPQDSARIYIQIGTDTLSTGNIDALQAYESLPINMLSIYTTRLFDLE